MIEFPVSGVETYWWLPAVVAFIISTFTSTGGLSGAFLILPFQVSVLGFTGPAVSPTNLVFNIIAIPSGVIRFWREKRMLWPLTWALIIGTLPGVFIGALIRIKYLPDPGAFKFFAGIVLLYIGIRLLHNIVTRKEGRMKADSLNGFFVSESRFDIRSISFTFNGEPYRTSNLGLFSLSFIVGIVGGTYGIGGGAIIAPFLVAIFGLPVYAIAGACLMSTFITSIGGVIFYSLLANIYADSSLAIRPDWLLGAMFGLGGAAGMYTGAFLQRHIPVKIIKMILVVCLLFVAIKYIVGYYL